MSSSEFSEHKSQNFLRLFHPILPSTGLTINSLKVPSSNSTAVCSSVMLCEAGSLGTSRGGNLTANKRNTMPEATFMQVGY
jgi:hypothetical protein